MVWESTVDTLGSLENRQTSKDLGAGRRDRGP